MSKCKDCTHEKICDLWRKQELQSACCFGDYFEQKNTPTDTPTKEKQIEEMEEIICDARQKSVYSVEIAEALYNAGYRKQSEGEWRYDGKFKACSLCGTFVEWNTLGTSHWKYCPHCGAKMKSKKEEH